MTSGHPDRCTMISDVEVAAGLCDIAKEMRRMLDGECPPYDAAWNIWGTAFSLAGKSPDVMHPLWLIWGSLTDWVENRPAETQAAETAMLRAAKEWLALDHDHFIEVKAYLDRWVFDEMGYERNGA